MGADTRQVRAGPEAVTWSSSGLSWRIRQVYASRPCQNPRLSFMTSLFSMLLFVANRAKAVLGSELPGISVPGTKQIYVARTSLRKATFIVGAI